MRPTTMSKHQESASRLSARIAHARAQLRQLEGAQPSEQWTAEDIEQARAIWQGQLEDLLDPLPAPPPRQLLSRRRNGGLWLEL